MPVIKTCEVCKVKGCTEEGCDQHDKNVRYFLLGDTHADGGIWMCDECEGSEEAKRIENVKRTMAKHEGYRRLGCFGKDILV